MPPIALELPPMDDTLHGRVALVTGGTSGIGFATAVNLVNRGFTVVITSQTRNGGEAAAEKIRNRTGKGSDVVDSIPLLTHGPLKDLERFAKDFRSKWSRLDIIVFNAGRSEHSHDKQDDGLCRCFVERLAYQHVLTSRFWNLLVSSGTTEFPSRVIITTGFAYRSSDFSAQEWLDLIQKAGCIEGQKLDFSATCVAQVGWTKVLAKACEQTNTPVRFLLTHPGFVIGTRIGSGSKAKCLFPCLAFFIGSHSPEEGCLPNVAAAVLVEPLPQGGFVGPVNITSGPPGIINLEEDDAECWKVFGHQESIHEIGKKALWELAVKTDSLELEKFCEKASVCDRRYDPYRTPSAPNVNGGWFSWLGFQGDSSRIESR